MAPAVDVLAPRSTLKMPLEKPAAVAMIPIARTTSAIKSSIRVIPSSRRVRATISAVDDELTDVRTTVASRMNSCSTRNHGAERRIRPDVDDPVAPAERTTPRRVQHGDGLEPAGSGRPRKTICRRAALAGRDRREDHDPAVNR